MTAHRFNRLDNLNALDNARRRATVVMKNWNPLVLVPPLAIMGQNARLGMLQLKVLPWKREDTVVRFIAG